MNVMPLLGPLISNFIIAYVGNLYTYIGGYFESSFVMVEVGILHAKLRGYFMYFS